ncbi:MAG: hypothetical protein KJP23_01555 [Deltaproteobacteria bacterium]|nr:hypothetical protein [Deltaproteobacteria bacterium]
MSKYVLPALFLRTAEPPIKSIHGARIRGIERMSKRIVFVFEVRKQKLFDNLTAEVREKE